MIMVNSSDPKQLTKEEIVALRGLRIPSKALKMLAESGIECEPALSKIRTGGSCVISGFESGGAVGPVGAYCGFVAEDGQPLPWKRRFNQIIGRNGKHAIVVAPVLVRIQVLRLAQDYELLVTKHEISVGDEELVNTILFRAHGHSRDEERSTEGAFLPAFCDDYGAPITVAGVYREAVVKVVGAAGCIGCHHVHSLVDSAAPPTPTVSIHPSGTAISTTPTVDELLADPSTSIWLKQALLSAVHRDPVDVTNDAELLLAVLSQRCDAILNQSPLDKEP